MGYLDNTTTQKGNLRWVLAGFAALVCASLVSYVTRKWAKGILLPEVFAQFVIEQVPGFLVALIIGLFGKLAKWIGFILTFAGFFFVSALLAFYYRRIYEILPSHSSPVKGLIFSLITTLMTLIVLVSIKIFAPGAVSGYAPVPAILSAVSFNLVFGLVLGILGDWAEKGDSPRSEKNLYGLESRRDFIFAAGIIVSSIALVGAIARDLLDAIDVGIGTAAGHIPSFFTPNNLFYTVQKDVGTPRLDSLKWSLRIDGLVRNPLLINFEELKAMSSDEQIVTLECIDNPVGGPLISNAKWRGVSLVKILERAGFNNEESLRIVVSGAGNYSDSFPASLLKDRNVMLAIEMNGQVLPPSHGFPARLITPGLYGIKNVKWVERIKVIKGDFEGYWQERGWTYDGTIKTMSKFSVPKNGDSFSENRIRLAGVAFAGARGLTKIEVSDDGGLNWQEAKLEDPVTGEDLSTVTSWRLWVMDWTPSRKGQHLLVVRATDGTGTVQIAELKDVFPDGSSGYHRIRVNVI